MAEPVIEIPAFVTLVKPAEQLPMRDLVSAVLDMFSEDYNLPQPQYLSISQGAQEISLQVPGVPASFHAMAAWADRFGGTITGQPGTDENNRPYIHCQVEFPFQGLNSGQGIRVRAYAYVKTGTARPVS